MVSKPICRDCVAGVQLFKWCQNLSAGTVLQGCSCLSGVKTYLLGLCCRGAAVQVVSKPICRDCVAGVQLFKWCQSLSAGTVLQRCSCLSGVKTYLPALCAGVQLFKWCQNISAGTMLQGCSCLRGVIPICRHCVAGVQLFKRCQNLSARTVLQGCSCLTGVETYLPGLYCRGAAV